MQSTTDGKSLLTVGIVQALAFGNTDPLPELYASIGDYLAFDAATLGEVVCPERAGD